MNPEKEEELVLLFAELYERYRKPWASGEDLFPWFLGFMAAIFIFVAYHLPTIWWYAATILGALTLVNLIALPSTIRRYRRAYLRACKEVFGTGKPKLQHRKLRPANFWQVHLDTLRPRSEPWEPYRY